MTQHMDIQQARSVNRLNKSGFGIVNFSVWLSKGSIRLVLVYVRLVNNNQDSGR